MSSVEDLETALADFQGVTVEDEGEYFNVKKKYERGPSGKQTWSKINQILKGYGGEWVSNGKWSHWKVPKQQSEIKVILASKRRVQSEQPSSTKELMRRLSEARDLIQGVIDEMKVKT